MLSAEELCSTAYKGFPTKETSDSEEGDTVCKLKERTMDDLLAFLQQEKVSPAETELLFQHRLQTLNEGHRQQLQKTERLHQQDLEKRMLHNSLLSAGNERSASVDMHLEDFFGPTTKRNIDIKPCLRVSRCEGPKRSQSLSDLSSVTTAASQAYSQLRRFERPTSTSAPWASGTTVPQPFNMTLRGTQKKLQLLQNKKPFSFMEREDKKKEEIKQQLGNLDLLPNTTKSVKIRTPIPIAVKDPRVSELLKVEEELDRKVRIQMRAQDMLRNSMAPIETQVHREDLERRCAQRTKKEALSFLEEKPTFQPRTSTQVPDFDKLYRVFQKEVLKRAVNKEVTKCQPFQLRTSALPPRQSKKSSDSSQEKAGKPYLKRSHSFSGITSLSSDTLPTYITDAARKRLSAIRRSMEEKTSKEQESAQWMQKHMMKSQAMKNTVTSRAKAMDPHKSLKEVYQEKLKQHRETDQKRMKEYKRELQEMNTRVKVRPYLFEQVTQKNAKSDAERRYRVRLEQVGLNELFVKKKGENIGVTPTVPSDDKNHSCENDALYTNGYTEKTIADVEGKQEKQRNELSSTEKETLCSE
ncbi:hypothetical protein AGOR_G00107190 [Albula goreensis]|uniref:Protein FAM161B n=1 Tax=Albula goreensis TaxID=1534307 RepID=A0A8T3DDI8_9TELE|nr:hypothetical protein AGOR_G00107190 [Albula goreensis]